MPPLTTPSHPGTQSEPPPRGDGWLQEEDAEFHAPSPASSHLLLCVKQHHSLIQDFLSCCSSFLQFPLFLLIKAGSCCLRGEI